VVRAEAPAEIAALSPTGVPVFGGLGLLDELACGSAGAMTGFSYAEALVACVRLLRRGLRRGPRGLHAVPAVGRLRAAGEDRLGIRKECLRVRGLIWTAAVRPPAAPPPDTLRVQLRRQMDHAESLVKES
jgi:4-hydroxy-tetrahydrodipicolinate synthase